MAGCVRFSHGMLPPRPQIEPESPSDPNRLSSSAPVVLASYFAVFAVLALPVLRVAASALPAVPNLYDSHLIAWILSWTSHALATDPSRVFDANIAYPAPGQLTGSEHLFALQLLFAPLRALGASPVLATNLTALVAYPLAAFAMERLLRALGFAAAVAWTIGLWFALAPFDATFNVHVLQYPHLWIPAVALRLVRLRARPDGRRSVALAVVYLLAIFTSYYAAVIASLTAGVWALAELCRRGPGRVRFLVLGALAAVVPITLLAAVMQPYLARAESSPAFLRAFEPTLATSLADVLPFATSGPAYLSAITWLETALALVGLAGAYLGGAGARRALPVAAASWALGSFLRRGLPPFVVSLLAASPLRSFRYVNRLSVLVFFGRALVWAAGLETLARWSRTRFAWTAPVATSAVVLALLGSEFGTTPMSPVEALRHEIAYRYVGQVWSENGGGALLELPITKRASESRNKDANDSLEPDAMLASTFHWWPTPAAYTGYHAPHRFVFLRAVARLPEERALADLIDATHLRWLLVRPAESWPSVRAHDDFVASLLASPAVGRSWDVDGWYLFELTRTPAHARWFRTIAEGPSGGETVLGTPLATLDPSEARASVELGLAAPTPSGAVRADVAIRNEGTRPWPGVPAPPVPIQLSGGRLDHTPLPGQVLLHARWRRVRVDGVLDSVVAEEWIPLDVDVDPGETLHRSIRIQVLPPFAGPHELEIAVEQFEGPRLDDGSPSGRRVIALTRVPRRAAEKPDKTDR